MRYISTRGGGSPQSFEEVLLTGLAKDGGLYVPESLPKISLAQMEAWGSLSYPELVLAIITPFIGSDIPKKDLKLIIEKSYEDFAHPQVAPVTRLGENEYLLELFHGPTLAFKDFALQVLGRMLDYVLTRNKQHVVILGATSGDTGSAALEGCRHSDYVDIFILHPYKRVSEVQRRQMTTVEGDNVFNLAVEGNFDDCQRIVKAAFADQSFLHRGRQLVAVNSINWARILMQIVYYFYAALKVGAPEQKVSFSVPTGNFGDIYAGYLSKCMGLPIEKLVVATNKNDILHRFISKNEYSVSELNKTFSPSMDILVSSNFERYLFDLFDRNGAFLTEFMLRFASESLSVSRDQWLQVKKHFDSYSVNDDETCEIITKVFSDHGVLLDPHSAVGVKSARECRQDKNVPMVILATAHPAKFAEAITASGLQEPALPAHLQDLLQREERYNVIKNELGEVVSFIKANTQQI
ncbi:MAG: threonine synthase [Gammaproteobacteria bacterium]|nr:threonine synthase [Gammaproteobacteria bacterium]|tara:strand:- start:839 stop:2236 length:1398 start_codon:yes stop_codon:yes gene_type:complete